MTSLTFDPYAVVNAESHPAKPANLAKTKTALADLATLAPSVEKSETFTESTLPPHYWLECYQKTYGEIREYECENEARTQAKREVFYAFVLRSCPEICKEFESLIKTYME